MLKLISNNNPTKSIKYQKGWRNGLKRISGLTNDDLSLDELKALLNIFKWSTYALEQKIRQKEKKLHNFQLKIVK